MSSPVPERFIDEQLAGHWKVDETDSSFRRLLRHLEVDSNFKPYFEEAMDHFLSALASQEKRDKLVLLDLGSGVCWTSALLARHERVRRVYAVDASEQRLGHARHILRHFGVPSDKVVLKRGTFDDFTIPERVDGVVLCASFHHCFSESTGALFSGIRKFLAPGGLVLVANEHYVDIRFTLHRFLSYLKHFAGRKELFYSPRNLRSPYPYDGEHWRTRKEVEHIFRRNGFEPDMTLHSGDLCKAGLPFYRKTGYHYYFAILREISSN